MQVLDRQLSSAVKTFHNPPLGAQLDQRIARDFTPRWTQQWGGKFMLHGKTPGANAIRLDGNDYLSVTGHPKIVQAQVLQQLAVPRSKRQDNLLADESDADDCRW